MTEIPVSTVTRTDQVKEFLLRFAASGLLPASLFVKNRPSKQSLTKVDNNITLEIVSHCWNYARFLAYQLSALVQYPPTQLRVRFTVFYSEEDQATSQLLQHFKTRDVPNVTWNFQPLPTPQLLRRAIGRNRAAKATQADWIWFTDCDVIFYEGCLDTLAELVRGRQELLLYPETLQATPLLSEDDALLQAGKDATAPLEIDTTQFSPRHYSRAAGPIQIMHGDAARACGYCDDLKVYQKPQEKWVKTYEDRALRWLLGTQGVPIPLPNVLVIRHAEKGRYSKNSRVSNLRKFTRKIKSKLINR